MYCMNFSNVNTGTAYNVRMSFFEYVLFNIGFKNYVINKVIDEWNINEYEFCFEGVTYGK